jgi:tetratricopeptide (TPR) repeat protein/predicted GTPase
MADVNSELAYLQKNLSLEEGEQIVATFPGEITGWGATSWEGLVAVTPTRLVYSSEPGFVSNGMCSWTAWGAISRFERSAVGFVAQFFDGNHIAFKADDPSGLAELDEYVTGRLPNVFAMPAVDAANRGFEAMQAEQWDKAVVAFREARRLDPRSALADMYLSECLVQLDHDADALEAAATAEKKGCGEALFLGNVRCRAHIALGEYPEAEREARRALSEGESFIARVMLARALRAQAKMSDAVEALRAGEAAHPEQPLFPAETADLLLELGDANGAAEALSSFSRARDHDTFLLALLQGRLLQLQGKNAEAAESLLRSSDDPERWNATDVGHRAAGALVAALSGLDRHEEVLAFTTKLRSALEEDALELLEWRTNALCELERWDDASVEVERALALPGHDDAQRFASLFARALIHVKLGAFEKGRVVVRQVRDIAEKHRGDFAKFRLFEHFIAYVEAAALVGLGRVDEALPFVRIATRSADPDLLEEVRALQDRLRDELDRDVRSAPAKERDGGEAGAGPSLTGRRNETFRLLKMLHDRLVGHLALDPLREDARRLKDDCERAVVLAVMGEFNAGKSTFINALLGQELLPTDVLPTTATINVLRWGDQPGARIVWQDGSVEEIAMERLRQYVSEQRDAKDNAVLRKIRYVEISVPQETLKRTWIVDTPGLNAIIPEHAEVTREFMKQADAVLWLFRADQSGKKSEMDALGLAGAFASKTLGVVNHIDRVPQDEVEELIDGVRQDFGSLLSTVVPLSAKKALAARMAKDRSNWERSGMPALVDALHRVVFTQSRPLKTASTLKKAIGLVAKVEAAEQAAVELHDNRMRVAARVKTTIQEQVRAMDTAIRLQRSRVSDGLRAACADVGEQIVKLASKRGWNLAAADVRYLSDALHGRIVPSLASATAELGRKAQNGLAQLEAQWSELQVEDGEVSAAWKRFHVESNARLREHELAVQAVAEYARGRLDAGELRDVAATAEQQGHRRPRDVADIAKRAYAFVVDKSAAASTAWSSTFHGAAIDAVEQGEEQLRERHDGERQERFRPVLRLRKPLEDALDAVSTNVSNAPSA